MEPDFSKIPDPAQQAIDFNAAAARNASGLSLRAEHKLEAALAAFDAALSRFEHPQFHSNRAGVLAELGRSTEALAAADLALLLQPNLAPAHDTRGLALRALGRWDEAVAAHTRALQLEPGLAEVHFHRALVLTDLGRTPAALMDFHTARGRNPALTDLAGSRLHHLMLACDWRTFEADLADVIHRIRRGEGASVSFPLLALCDDPALHRRAAERAASRWTWAWASVPPLTRPAQGSKIRVGYFSMDFRAHAVAHLMADVFAAHDRSAFEVHAFSYGPDTGDGMRKRLEQVFDQFHDVRGQSDTEIAALARAQNIDVAVDLAGYTGDARTGIFAARTAPVQIQFLGYPGTLGAPFVDTVIADAVTIPPEAEGDYAEKVLRLPCFQPPGPRASAAPTPSRAALGLPEDAFVFCCFNRAYKITPAMFSSWMRILDQVPRGVLWLSLTDPLAQDNLRLEARSHGINPARLFFAGRIAAMDEHLARQRAADLFLDTFPYGAHTTAADALKEGLPVLTLAGRSFASRVGASVLNALGLAELITSSSEDYERAAVTLAHDPARLAALRARLKQNAPGHFDTARFTRSLEDAFREALRL